MTKTAVIFSLLAAISHSILINVAEANQNSSPCVLVRFEHKIKLYVGTKHHKTFGGFFGTTESLMTDEAIKYAGLLQRHQYCDSVYIIEADDYSTGCHTGNTFDLSAPNCDVIRH